MEGFSLGKLGENPVRVGSEENLPRAPSQPQRESVQGVIGEEETSSSLVTQPVMDEIEVEGLIAAIQFVADHRISDVGKVDAKLMLSACGGPEAQE